MGGRGVANIASLAGWACGVFCSVVNLGAGRCLMLFAHGMAFLGGEGERMWDLGQCPCFGAVPLTQTAATFHVSQVWALLGLVGWYYGVGASRRLAVPAGILPLYLVEISA